MRTVHWLYLVSVALFLAGLGLFVASARRAQLAPPLVMPTASVKQIMKGLVVPASTAVFSSVGTVISTAGVEEKAPKDTEEWEAVETSAALIVESGNLLMLGGRLKDEDEWVKQSRAMMEAGEVAMKAAKARNAEALLASGEAIDVACDSCHTKYQK